MSFPFQKKINQWLGVAPMFFCFFPEMVNPFSRWWWHHSVLILLNRCRALAVRWRGIVLASRLPKCQRSTRGFCHCQNCRCLAKRGELRDRDEATYQTRRRRSFLVTPLPIYGKCPIKGRDISGWWNPPEYHHESKINKRHRLEDVFFVTFWWQAK